MQASPAHLADLEPADPLDTGASQRGEQLRGAGRAVAPVVRHRLHLPLRRREGVLDDEPVVLERAHGQQVLRALPRGSDEVRPPQGVPGDGQRRGHAGGAVREVR